MYTIGLCVWWGSSARVGIVLHIPERGLLEVIRVEKHAVVRAPERRCETAEARVAFPVRLESKTINVHMRVQVRGTAGAAPEHVPLTRLLDVPTRQRYI